MDDTYDIEEIKPKDSNNFIRSIIIFGFVFIILVVVIMFTKNKKQLLSSMEDIRNSCGPVSDD